MNGSIRFAAKVIVVAVFVLLSCVASKEKIVPSKPVRVDTTTTLDTMGSDPVNVAPTPYEPESVQPNIQPFTSAEVQSIEQSQERVFQRGVVIGRSQSAQAATRAVSVATTPILDQRQRECIGYTINESLTRTRMNLFLLPNLYDVTIRNWSNPQWLETFRVEGGTFPVNLWRKRAGAPDQFIKQVRVQAGPRLPNGLAQGVLSGADFRGGDVLCVEATRSAGPLFVAYDQQTGLVVQPQLSVIQNAGGDSTPMPGQWTTVGARD